MESQKRCLYKVMDATDKLMQTVWQIPTLVYNIVYNIIVGIAAAFIFMWQEINEIWSENQESNQEEEK